MLDSKGNVYGTTQAGGTTKCGLASGCGTVFQQGQDKERVLHAFLGAPTDGGFPASPLLNSGGVLYGTTSETAYDCGTIFKITPVGATASARAAKRKGK